ncbi:Translation initiation factor 1A [Coemansia sp. RSA 552]|nr:Translation initiation factor 1A [Coemansia sp. RSA 552]
MPKNKGKGGKARRKGKGGDQAKRELTFKTEGQEYGQVVKVLGNGRMDVQCIDGVKRLGHIRGAMRKKVWVQQGDWILVGLRDFQDNKCDILEKYKDEEVVGLKKAKQLPEKTKTVKEPKEPRLDGEDSESESESDSDDELVQFDADAEIDNAIQDLDIDEI